MAKFPRFSFYLSYAPRLGIGEVKNPEQPAGTGKTKTTQKKSLCFLAKVWGKETTADFPQSGPGSGPTHWKHQQQEASAIPVLTAQASFLWQSCCWQAQQHQRPVSPCPLPRIIGRPGLVASARLSPCRSWSSDTKWHK